jgi:hypothetical protein
MAVLNGIGMRGSGSYADVPIFNALVPREGPRAIPLSFDFSVQSLYSVDFSQAVSQGQISMVQSAFIDNSENAATVILTIPSSGQVIKFPASSQGFITLYSANPPRFTVSSSGAGVVGFVISNMATQNMVWPQAAALDPSTVAIGSGPGGGSAITPFVNPTQALFSYSNSGGPILTDTSAGITVTGAAGASVNANRIAGLTAPFNIEAGFLMIAPNEDYYGFGLLLQAGVAGLMEVFGVQHNGSDFIFFVENLTASYAWAGTPLTHSASFYGASGPIHYLRVRDDLTLRHYEISPDCSVWMEVFNRTRSTYAVMDRGGFMLAASPSYQLAARLVHYREY